MRNQPSSWVRLLTKLGFARTKRRIHTSSGFRRSLRFEQCEDRCMLATFSVTNNSDAPVNTPAAVGTLRQAIFDANQSQDALDTIKFSESAFANGGTILLTQGQLSITESNQLIIDGRNTAGVPLGIVISAGDGSDHTPNTGDGFRIFRMVLGSAIPDIEINSLTLTGGDLPSGADPRGGGAISCEVVNLTLKNSVITGNASQERGGGIRADFDLAV